MSVIEKLKTKEEIIEAVDKFAENIKTKEEREEFAEEIEYILEDRLEEKDLKRIKEIILKEEGDGSMSHVHEVLRKDAERERKEERKATLMEVVQKMLNEKLDIDLISRITGIKKEQFIK